MFSKLIGNERVKETLRRMLAGGRVPGALLLTGEEGVGKKLFALELAKALNCRQPVGLEACDVCSSCKRITQIALPAADDKEAHKKIIWSSHTDVGLARPYNRAIPVDAMRDLEREANFRPFEGAARVLIIEDADKLNEASSNALLKTLEEPPATSYLILLTSRPAALLPTIRSRCQTMRFSPLTPAEIEDCLRQDKQLKLSAEDARLLSYAARGSIGRARSGDVESYRQRREAMLDVLNALALTHDRARLLRASEELTDAKRKEEYEPRLDVLETLIHDAWSLALDAKGERLVNQDLAGQLKKIAAQLTSRRAARWLAQIETHRRGLEVNINRKVATDALFLAMSQPEV
ncbi:MAG: polymerase subunit delta' [Blastocatellia bacterium]|jgi:DNA polymerase-3 subunit delta'|nr:polymerase subunit delta' [Blastocatellia bacterium]